MTFTSVVGYHMQPLTCGVARFNTLLAQRLGVPFVANTDTDHWGDFPLLSLKWAELDANHQTFTRSKCWPDVRQNSAEVMRTATAKRYGVFWHDAGDATITAHAEHVFYADPSLGSPGLWCPSMVPVTPRPVKLFSFGMAHKLQTAHYEKVRRLLDDAGKRYHLRVSVGLHEGTSLADATQHFDALKDIMGHDRVTILGCLSDEAVSEELHNADYVLAFIEKGVRANNTTYHAAFEHGKPVIATFDRWSPVFAYDQSFDINELEYWPHPDSSFTWERLIERMEQLCEASASAPA